MTRTAQLRRYQLTPETLDVFVTWWREDLLPVRRAFGFDVPWSCVVPETAELLWVVTLPGDEAAFAEAQRRYDQWPQRVESMSRQPVQPTGATAAFIRDPLGPAAG